MKKIISTILCICVLFTLCGNVFAASDSTGTVTVLVENNTFTPTEEQSYPTGYILEPYEIEILEDDTVMSVILCAFDENEIAYNKDEETGELTGGYLSSIGGLSEMDGGASSGWLICVNDWFATVGAASQYPSDGDIIKVSYSLDWGADLGSVWGSNDTSLESLSFEGGTLSPEFSSEVYEYELILNRDVSEVSAAYAANNKNYQVRTYKNATVTDGIIEGEADYESELSGLAAPENDLTDILGYYKNGKDIPVSENDIITIGCGLTGWTTMNETEGGCIYTITVKPYELSEIESRIDAKYAAYTDFLGQNPTNAEFAEEMAPSILDLYSDFVGSDEVSSAHAKKLFTMLGKALASGITLDIEDIYTNAKIEFELNSAFTVSKNATLRLTVTPKKNDEYISSNSETLYSTSLNLSQEKSEFSVKVSEMSRSLKVNDKIDFYLDLSYDSNVLCRQHLGKAVVKSDASSDYDDDYSGGGGGGGGYTPPEEPEEDPTQTPEEVTPAPVTPSSPYVYFSVPEKTQGKEATFTDLSEFSWAAESINALVKDGVLNGISETEFDPGADVTREQFVKMLVLAFNIEIPTQVVPTFTDVDNTAWYAPYIYAASYAGIAQGASPEYFGIGQKITREDMATMLHRAIGSPETSYVPPYVDYADIADYAKPAVSLLSDEGTISGYMELSGTYFRPKNLATRAEAAKMIYKAK